VDERLKRAIAAPRIQQQAGELVALALQALDDLKQFVASRRQPAPEAGAESLRGLWELTFAGLLDFLAYCRVLGSDAPSHADANELSTSFDWADLEGGSTETVATADLNLGSSDIGDLLENIDEHVEEGDTERWAKVLAKARRGGDPWGLKTSGPIRRRRVRR